MANKISNKILFIFIISVIVLLILAVIGVSLFNSHQNNASAKKPVITSISPTSVPAGAPAIDLRVYGHNLETNSIINWNGSPMKTDSAFVSYGFLKAIVPLSSLASAGKYNITITNSPTGGGTSDPIQFQVVPVLLQIK